MAGYIVDSGMGGYLDPPEYPTHTKSVHEGPRSNPHSMMGLEAAVNAAYLSESVRKQAADLLAAWHANRPALDSPEVLAWIANCRRHWKSCWYSETADDYRSHCASPHSRHAQPRPEGAIEYATYHIHRFYPEYQP